MTPYDADGALDDIDVTLLDQLRELHEAVDPVPEELAHTVKFRLTVQALQAEVAELQRLGADAELLAHSRSVDYDRIETLTFTSDTLTVLVTVTSLSPTVARLDGWVEGEAAGGPIEVEIRCRTKQLTVTVDDDGRFSCSEVERGMVQLVLHPASTDFKPIITPTVEM